MRSVEASQFVVLALGGGDCEALRDGWLHQPANAVSSLAYVAAGLWARRRGAPAAPSAALVAVGVGSALYHGPMPPCAGLAHDGALVLLGLSVAAVAVRRRALPRPPAGAVAALAAGLALYLASRTGGPLCRPHSLLQGHAAWHTLTALGASLWLSRLARHDLAFLRPQAAA